MTQETASPVRRARLRLGLTLLELAEECAKRGASVSEGQMSRIERGEHTPRPRLRRVLAEVLDIDANDDFQARSA